jgi:hypothetical protein
VNLPDLETQVLLELDDRGFISLSWDEPEYLKLFTFEGQEWHYEFATGELEPVPQ